MQYIVFRNYGTYNTRNIFKVASSLTEAIHMVPASDVRESEKAKVRAALEGDKELSEPLYFGEAGIYPVQS